MDETTEEEVITVGERLRQAREAKGLSLDEVAASTRIPTRHLLSLEAGEWDKLPSATYSVGFAKNYAAAIGLDRNEIGEQLRAEMGEVRPTYVATEQVYDTADPARTMPKGLVVGALVLLAVMAGLLLWARSRELQPDAPAVAAAPETGATNDVAPTPEPPAAANQPVVLTATEAVWVQIKDGTTTLKMGEMAPGERYEVPATAAAPVLMTGKPEGLQISVGTQTAPAVGPAGRRVSDVSLKGDALLGGGAATPAAGSSAPVNANPTPSTTPRQRPASSTSRAVQPSPTTPQQVVEPVAPPVDTQGAPPPA